ncbi:MAG: hypothetical protein HOG23_04350 [Flavobacteriaceae bacterium]|nr:hypothetical protein [Flavobacteriaceae bacterium]MBT4952411.1 hypothetical protein [Pelagibacteraceae bacterium]MBT4415815.1 hypothetical protein [Flavobacteriaceae bacterium]MBT5595902.1 hypothetical protein [Flavobacteriaceae bacterium]MBT6688643.1 hypothetical protein [Flavobacteriaceae bacterium]
MTDDLIRISVGLENINDINQALNNVNYLMGGI